MDSSNNLYVTTGNAAFDVTSDTPPNNDYGDSFLKFSTNLGVTQYFTPADEASDNRGDLDFGSGGATLIDLPASGTNPVHLVAGGGKDGYLYLLDRDKMGGFGDSNAWQRLNFGNGIFGTSAFWNGHLYLAGMGGSLKAFSLDATTAKLSLYPSSISGATFQIAGATPSVSSMADGTNGIVWALDYSTFCTRYSPGCGPAVLHAYDAGNLANDFGTARRAVGTPPATQSSSPCPRLQTAGCTSARAATIKAAATKAHPRQGNWMSSAFCPTDPPRAPQNAATIWPL